MSPRGPSLPEDPLDPGQFGELVVLATELKMDALDDFPSLLTPDAPPRARRRFVRAFFASVEGITSTLRRLALSRHSEGKVAFSAREVARLREERRRGEGDEGDEGSIVPLKDSFDRRVAFSLRMFARAYELEHVPLDSDREWKAFKASIEIRHRLTHPKKIADLTVGDGEAKTLHQAFEWFWRRTIDLMNAAQERIGGRWV